MICYTWRLIGSSINAGRGVINIPHTLTLVFSSILNASIII